MHLCCGYGFRVPVITKLVMALVDLDLCLDVCLFVCDQVRKKTLDLAMELVTSRTVEELVLVLKKEVTKTHNTVEHEDVGK